MRTLYLIPILILIPIPTLISSIDISMIITRNSLAQSVCVVPAINNKCGILGARERETVWEEVV